MWQPIGWLLSMLFVILAFLPGPRELAASLKTSIRPRTAFFLFWILFFVVSHLWNFRTAPWNGNALFDESGWDLWYLKSYVIGHPYQPAWFHAPISRETLFHYYVLGFLRLFGFNILSYEAALFCIWLATFVFTLLLVHLFFKSYIVTSITALIFSFLPFAFIYTFAGYRYPLAVALAVASLYFLHLGFRLASSLFLSLGGIAAGLCLASSISGKQYLLALVIAGPLYGAFHWKRLTQRVTWKSLALVFYGFAAAATPIVFYIWFNRGAYTYYESAFLQDFWRAMRISPFPVGIRPYTKQLFNCFFTVPGVRFFIPDTLPIPLPYYWLLLPGLLLALWQKRFEIGTAGDNSCSWRLYCYLLRKSPASSNPILGHVNEFHVCGAVEPSTMAGRADCFWCHIRIDIATRTSPVDSIHLRQNEESVFDSPLCAGGGRCLPLLETCCSRPGTSRPSAAGTRRVQSHSRSPRSAV